jgi:hypothetical protein
VMRLGCRSTSVPGIPFAHLRLSQQMLMVIRRLAHGILVALAYEPSTDRFYMLEGNARNTSLPFPS